MSKITKQGEAHKWILEGIKQHKEFKGLFSRAKDVALNAGFFFLSAKERVEPGEWENFLAGYSSEIATRTVRFYMEFAGEAVEWVHVEHPKLLGLDKIAEAARHMVLQSPKGLVALCRDLKLMRRFGEYDAVKYKATKIKGNDQIEFNFFAASETLQLICNPKVRLPEDLTQAEELVGTLKSAAIRAERHVQELRRTVDIK